MSIKSLGVLTVDVVANVGGLTDGADRAARSLDKLTAQERKQQQQLERLIGQIDPVAAEFQRLDRLAGQLKRHFSEGLIDSAQFDQLNAKLDAMRSRVDGAAIRTMKEQEAALNRTGSAMLKNGLSARQYSSAMRLLPAQISDIVVSLASGQPAYLVALQQGAQLKDAFGGIGNAAKAMARALLGANAMIAAGAAAAGALAYAYVQASKETDNFNRALLTTGNRAGVTIGQLREMATELDKITTYGQGAEVLNLLVGSVGGEDLRQSAEAAIVAARSLGMEVDDVAKNYEAIAQDPAGAYDKLSRALGFLSAEERERITILQETGQHLEAAAVAQRAYTNALLSRAREMDDRMSGWSAFWRSIADTTKEAVDNVAGLFRETPLRADYNRGGGRGRPVNADAIESRRQAEEAERAAAADRARERQRNDAMAALGDLLRKNRTDAEKLRAELAAVDNIVKQIEANGGAVDQRQIAQLRASITARYDRSAKAVSETSRLSETIKLVEALEQEAATLGKTGAQLKLYELEQRNAGEAEMARAMAAVHAIDAYEKQQDALRAYHAVVQSLQSTEEKRLATFREQIRAIQEAPGLNDDQRAAGAFKIAQNVGFDPMPQYGGLDPFVGGEMSELERIDEAQARLEEWRRTQLDQLRAFRSERADLESEWNRRERDIRAAHDAELAKMDRARMYVAITTSEEAFGSLAEVMKAAHGEQSGIYKAMFAASKAFSVAQSMIAIQTGIAQAAALPFPANLAAMATVAAATANIIASIQAVALNGFEAGGYTGNLGRGDIAGVVHGREFVVNADATARYRPILEKMNGGGQTMRIVSELGFPVQTVPFEAGGYTGNLGRGDIAGVVHGREFVVNADATARYRPILEKMNNGAAMTVGGGQTMRIVSELGFPVQTVPFVTHGEMGVRLRYTQEQAVSVSYATMKEDAMRNGSVTRIANARAGVRRRPAFATGR